VEAANRSCLLAESSMIEYQIMSYLNITLLYSKAGIDQKNIYFAEKALALDMLDMNTRAYFMMILAEAYLADNRVNDGEQALLDWLDYSKSNGLYEHEIKALQHLGMWYYNKEDYSSASRYYYDMATCCKGMLDKENVVVALNNASLCEMSLKNYAFAETNLQYALTQVNVDEMQKGDIILSLASIAKAQNNFQEAKRQIELARTVAIRSKDAISLCRVDIAEAGLLKSLGNIDYSYLMARDVLATVEKNGFRSLLNDVLELLRSCSIAKKDFSSEKVYAGRIKALNNEETLRLDILRQQKFKKLLEVANIERNCHEEVSNYKRIELEREHNELDRINQEKSLLLLKTEQELIKSEKERALIAKNKAQEELKFQTAQLALNNLNYNKTLADLENVRTKQLLELTTKNLESEKAKTDLLVTQQRNQLLESESGLKDRQIAADQQSIKYGLVIGFLFVVALLMTIFGWKKTRKQNDLIQSHANELHEKNTDITRSIESAAYFQQSLTPTETYISSLFRDSLTYYKPLDIVSGDLPFVMSYENYLFVAAIDCVGHGVPAAMLSFTIHYSLKDIIEKYPEKETGALLKILHNKILKKLMGDKERLDFLSGADISLVKIDRQSRSIQFSGAKSPLITVNTGGLINYKGDNISLADQNFGFSPEFSTQYLTATEGTKYFLMTDGFADQQLEGKSKTFSKKRLQTILELSPCMSMKNLMLELDSAHKTWKGQGVQTDDMLIMGFEI
jgi:serine phosphatase RsbU (regulator of sigma subunit)